MRANNHRALAFGAAAPFMVAACLIALMLLAPLTGMAGPSSNTFFLSGAAAIALAACLGIGSLLTMGRTRRWVRLAIGLLYLPTILASLLLIGA